MVLGVRTMLPPRTPAGDVKLAENAETTEQAWNLLLDLEDVNYMHSEDKRRAIKFVTESVELIREARQPCGFWDKVLNRGTCR